MSDDDPLRLDESGNPILLESPAENWRDFKGVVNLEPDKTPKWTNGVARFEPDTEIE
jgi:hypothetical protein